MWKILLPNCELCFILHNTMLTSMWPITKMNNTKFSCCSTHLADNCVLYIHVFFTLKCILDVTFLICFLEHSVRLLARRPITLTHDDQLVYDCLHVRC